MSIGRLEVFGLSFESSSSDRSKSSSLPLSSFWCDDGGTLSKSTISSTTVKVDFFLGVVDFEAAGFGAEAVVGIDLRVLDLLLEIAGYDCGRTAVLC